MNKKVWVVGLIVLSMNYVYTGQHHCSHTNTTVSFGLYSGRAAVICSLGTSARGGEFPNYLDTTVKTSDGMAVLKGTHFCGKSRNMFTVEHVVVDAGSVPTSTAIPSALRDSFAKTHQKVVNIMCPSSSSSSSSSSKSMEL